MDLCFEDAPTDLVGKFIDTGSVAKPKDIGAIERQPQVPRNDGSQTRMCQVHKYS